MTKAEILKEDYEYISRCSFIPWERLRSKTILVTGGTGLICSTLIKALSYLNAKYHMNIQIIALVRDKQKAISILGDSITYINGTVERLPDIDHDIDFIIHGASPTASEFFICNPVETIKTGVIGTTNLLDLSVAKKVKGFIYLSSMEVYGRIIEEFPLREEMLGYLNPTDIRSCYPETKRLCESLCHAYAIEYGIDACSIRLAQTFGPGIAYDDKRIFAEIARCVIETKDIVLRTSGSSKHSYLYTAQAVSAILTILLKGKAGDVYNASNPNTYCSIYDMGKMVAEELAGGLIDIVVNNTSDTTQYPKESMLNLDVEKIMSLEWKPFGDLKYIYSRMISCMMQSDTKLEKK